MESQSRYGIMENLGQKKLNAQTALDNLEKEITQQEMHFNKHVATLAKDIENENAHYKNDFKQWKENALLGIRLKEQEHKQEIQKLKDGIKNKEDTYVDEHKKKVRTAQEQSKSHKDNWKHFTKLKNMEKEAKKKEISQINESIKSLKEISKEQKTKE